MLLHNQTTNHHLKLVTPTPTGIIPQVIILTETLLITRGLYLIKNQISSFDEINISTLNETQNVNSTQRKTGRRRA